MTNILNLISILSRLRGPGGCSWDQKQTNSSFKDKIIEEAGEVVHAIDSGDDNHLCEELGDVLINIALHAQIASERGAFTLEDVARVACEKLVRRHPHVFGDNPHTLDEAALHAQWNRIKREEKKTKGA